MTENENEQQTEHREETVTEKVTQEPVADEGGPLGNVTKAVTEPQPTTTVTEHTEETVVDKFDNEPARGEDNGRNEFSNTEEMQDEDKS